MAVSWSLGKPALERRNDELRLQAGSDVIPYKITDPIRLLSQMQKYFAKLQRLDGLDPATGVKLLNIVFGESTEIIPTKCLKTKFKAVELPLMSSIITFTGADVLYPGSHTAIGRHELLSKMQESCFSNEKMVHPASATRRMIHSMNQLKKLDDARYCLAFSYEEHDDGTRSVVAYGACKKSESGIGDNMRLARVIASGRLNKCPVVIQPGCRLREATFMPRRFPIELCVELAEGITPMKGERLCANDK